MSDAVPLAAAGSCEAPATADASARGGDGAAANDEEDAMAASGVARPLARLLPPAAARAMSFAELTVSWASVLASSSAKGNAGMPLGACSCASSTLASSATMPSVRGGAEGGAAGRGPTDAEAAAEVSAASAAAPRGVCAGVRPMSTPRLVPLPGDDASAAAPAAAPAAASASAGLVAPEAALLRACGEAVSIGEAPPALDRACELVPVDVGIDSCTGAAASLGWGVSVTGAGAIAAGASSIAAVVVTVAETEGSIAIGDSCV